MSRNFMDLVRARWEKGLFSCVGLDLKLSSLPESFRTFHSRNWSYTKTLFEFNRGIVEATANIVAAYKPNYAFYAAGPSRLEDMEGLTALRQTIEYIRGFHPEIPVILDYKRADIGDTNVGYVAEGFDAYGADAVTVNPYFGMLAMEPFLAQPDKGIIILCRTSNPGAGEFQDLQVIESHLSDDALGIPPTRPLYQVVAKNVAKHWNRNGNCWLVVGATYPRELAEVRKIVGDLPLLIPGFGKQGGLPKDVVPFAKDSKGQGFLANQSSAVTYAYQKEEYSGLDPIDAARAATEKFNHELAAARAV